MGSSAPKLPTRGRGMLHEEIASSCVWLAPRSGRAAIRLALLLLLVHNAAPRLGGQQLLQPRNDLALQGGRSGRRALEPRAGRRAPGQAPLCLQLRQRSGRVPPQPPGAACARQPAPTSATVSSVLASRSLILTTPASTSLSPNSTRKGMPCFSA